MFNYKNYKNERLIFTKPIPFYGSYEKIGIYNKKNGRKIKIIIQIPPMFIPFEINKITKNNKDHYSICISFSKKDISNNVNSFYNFVNYLDRRTKHILETKKDVWFKKKRMVHKPILSNYKTMCEFMSIDMPHTEGKFKFDIYDEQKRKVSIDQLTKNTEVSIIAELSNFWTNGKQVGCNWTCLQIKKYDILNLDECMIIDDEEMVSNQSMSIPIPPPILTSLPINSEYEKYFKMLKMGIPLIAVKNNMMRDGHDIDFVNSLPENKDEFKNKLNSQPAKKSLNKIVPSHTELSDMKGLLKKTSQTKQTPLLKKKDGFAPTLDDIQNILNRLKKPGEEKEKNKEKESVSNLTNVLNKKRDTETEKKFSPNLLDLLNKKRESLL